MKHIYGCVLHIKLHIPSNILYMIAYSAHSLSYPAFVLVYHDYQITYFASFVILVFTVF